MPAHASHRLQPLELVCFSVLKRAYRNVINEKINLRVHSIDKFEFLDAYPKARMQAFRADNIESAYRTAGLFPPERNHVLSKLALNICISTTEREQGAEDVTREDVQEGPKTPSKHEKLKKLSSAANYWLPQVNTVARSPLKLIFKGYDEAAQTFLESAVVLSNEVTRGRVANMLQGKKRARPKREFILESDLSVEEVDNIFSLVPEVSEFHNDEVSEQTNAGSPRRKRGPYSCRGCGISGHTIRTCPEKSR
ncbi:hypothetical protein JCM33374_g5016 [Metschnikowia sp. JCM 33374]|nr:hypothetical protein JCM33374_g5016 [Metschnikowia sp. JCM 33374]